MQEEQAQMILPFYRAHSFTFRSPLMDALLWLITSSCCGTRSAQPRSPQDAATRRPRCTTLRQ